MNKMIHFLHKIFGLKSITSRFFFWVIVFVFLTSSLYLCLFITIDKNKRIEEAKMNLNYITLNQQMIIENWSNDRMEDIRLLASFPVSKNMQLDVMAKRFKYYHDYYEQLHAIVFIDANGLVKIDTATKDLIIADSKVSLQDRDYFIAAKNGEEYIYDVVVSKANDEPAIIFSAPVLSDYGNFQGVLFGAVHLSKINEMLARSLYGESGKVTLINEEGFVISSLSQNSTNENEQQIFVERVDEDIIKLMKKEKKGLLQFVNDTGEKVFVSFASMYDGRYFLMNEINKKEVLQSHYQMVTTMIMVVLAIIVVGILLIIPVSRQLLRPFIYLVNAITRMKEGKYNTQLDPIKFESSPIELQQMMKVFNEMSSSIQENKQLLEHLSNTDGLTGIANRRLFEDTLALTWKQAVEKRHPLSLLFIDIDYFKQFNDRFGHQKGDQCLIKIANALQELVENKKDLVARYGGEEFVIILPNTKRKEAIEVSEKVRRKVEKLQIKRSLEQKRDYVTVSIGVATMVPSVETAKESLIQLADQALYEAKNGGRNRVIVKERE